MPIKTFRFDLRSFALFRIVLALIVLFDLSVRATSLTAHYTDLGAYPRLLNPGGITHFSIYNFVGSSTEVGIFFLVHAICALSMLVGFRTRIATALTWFFTISLHNRNFLVLNTGDLYLRILLLWAIFLPTGRRFSFDSRSKDKASTWGEGDVSYSPATIGFTLQVFFVYFFSGLVKAIEPTWREGLGVYYAMNTDLFATALGKWIGAHQVWTYWLNFLAIFVEFFGAFLVFVPLRKARLRWTAIAIFFTLHVGIALTLEVGTLSYVSMAAWLSFLPSSFWRDSVNLKETRESPNLLLPVSVVLTSVALLVNLNTLDWPPKALPEPLATGISVLKLEQDWSVFRIPTIEDGWMVVPGTLKNALKVDLFRGGTPVTLERPQVASSLAKDMRWRKFGAYLFIYSKSKNVFESYSKYLCRSWNETHSGEEALVSLEIIRMTENTLKEGGKAWPIPTLLFSFSCEKG